MARKEKSIQMVTVTLDKYVKSNTQCAVARALGITPPAVSNMLRNKREVYLQLDSTGKIIDFYEIRREFKPALSAKRLATQPSTKETP